jgi:hypothetical protein
MCEAKAFSDLGADYFYDLLEPKVFHESRSALPADGRLSI